MNQINQINQVNQVNHSINRTIDHSPIKIIPTSQLIHKSPIKNQVISIKYASPVNNQHYPHNIVTYHNNNNNNINNHNINNVSTFSTTFNRPVSHVDINPTNVIQPHQQQQYYYQYQVDNVNFKNVDSMNK